MFPSRLISCLLFSGGAVEGIVVFIVVIFLTSSDFMLEVFYCLYNLFVETFN